MSRIFNIQYFLLIAVALLISCGDSSSSGYKKKTESVHPEWVYDAVIYEVNTRQFTPEGTFNALTEHLPRFQELGVDILWFMPIQTIGEEDRKGTLGSYYSIKNYTEINSEFGTLDDFKSVVSVAHNLGMKVVLDWVANHTSRDAVWVEEHPEWYVRDSLGGLAVRYDWTDIAQLDYSNDELRSEMISSMMFWINETDIDGFRCDVAYELPTDFWVVASDSFKSLKSDIFLLAEAEKPELNETVFNAFYAWDFHHTMNSVAQGKSNVDSLRLSLSNMISSFPSHAIPMFFTSNHDENSWNGTEFERMGEAAEAFAALIYVMPGMPLIYSGQEVGFDNRLEFFEKDTIDWTDTDSFTDFYAELSNLKEHNPALQSQEKDGEMVEITNSNPGSVWSFSRKYGDNEVISVFNLTDQEVDVTFNEQVPGRDYYTFPDSNKAESVKEMTLSPWSYKIYYK